MKGFTDVDWVGSLDDRMLTSGYCTFIGGNLVTWRCKRKITAVRSSAVVEYKATMLRSLRLFAKKGHDEVENIGEQTSLLIL